MASSAAAPRWLRLTRSGASFTAPYSADGSPRTTISPVTLNGMATNAAVGLVVSSKDTSNTRAATFSNLSLANVAPTVAMAPAASSEIVSGRTTTLTVLGDDDAGEQPEERVHGLQEGRKSGADGRPPGIFPGAEDDQDGGQAQEQRRAEQQ